MNDQDTIAAIATAPGPAAIGIVRLSGPQALPLATALLDLPTPLVPTRARFTRILDPETSQPLDEAIVTFFAAPHSYTSEDVVEIACHGAPILLHTILQALIARGARLASPGEFTQRAFLAGRLDLTQSEAVNDLIHATTLHQARLAAAQLGGSLARTLATPRQKLINLIAQLEAGVDFAEDDLDLLPPAEILTTLQSITQSLQSLADTYQYGSLVRTGFTLALIGRPNAGKSSLFNRLLGRDRAIVTPEPGTTRDSLSEPLALAGIPVHLVDTAGLRDQPSGPAEAEGIRRTHTHIAEADLILQVLDATNPTPQPLTQPHLTVLNKSDLAPTLTLPNTIATSALTGHGIDTLRTAILQTLTATTPSADTALITNLRQQTALLATLTSLRAATHAATTSLPHEFLLLDLHTALASLGSLTGATTPDDILNLIFSTFCIGK